MCSAITAPHRGHRLEGLAGPGLALGDRHRLWRPGRCGGWCSDGWWCRGRWWRRRGWGRRWRRGLRLSGRRGGSGRRLRRRRCRRGRFGRLGERLWRARLDEGEDVLLRHAAATARALDLARVDAVLGGDPRDDRRDERLAVARRVLASDGLARARGRTSDSFDGLRARGRLNRSGGGGRLGCGRRGCRLGDGGGGLGRRCGRLGRGCGRLGRRRSGLGDRLRVRLRRRRALRCDHRQLRPDLDRLALLHQDLADDARAGARHLGVDLVRRDLEQRLVGLDRLALLLEPAA